MAGAAKADVIRTALDVLQSGAPETVHVDLTEDISMQALGVCGGTMDVFIERTRPADVAQPGGFLDALRESMLNRVPVALASVVSGNRVGRSAVVWLDRPPLGGLDLGEQEAAVIEDARSVLRGRQHKLLKYDDFSVFVEVQRRAPEMLIVGVGHIALPLAQVAACATSA